MPRGDAREGKKGFLSNRESVRCRQQGPLESEAGPRPTGPDAARSVGAAIEETLPTAPSHVGAWTDTRHSSDRSREEANPPLLLCPKTTEMGRLAHKTKKIFQMLPTTTKTD